MKSLFASLVIVLAFSGLAHSDTEWPTRVYEVGISSVTTTIITVSTSTATQMDNPSMVNRAAVEIQNIDASANLWCAPRTNPAANAGRKLLPAGAWSVNMADRSAFTGSSVHLYCLSDGASSTKAAVTQAW